MTLRQYFEKAARDAGLPPVGLHGLRHTWATLALRAGASPKTVSSRLGHRKVSFTLDQYAHAVPDWAAEEAGRANAAILGR